jgi:hypothetical protein
MIFKSLRCPIKWRCDVPSRTTKEGFTFRLLVLQFYNIVRSYNFNINNNFSPITFMH